MVHGEGATYHDEMTSYVGRTMEEALIGAEEITDVIGLQYQQHYPVYTGDHGVQAEWCGHVIVLSPYCMAVLLVTAVSRSLDSIDYANHHDEEP